MNSSEELKALEKALDAAKDYADVVVKGPLSELGGIFGDTVGFWRLKNKVNLMLKAKKWLEEKGIEPDQLLPSIFLPLLEDGSYVEDEMLADMFSSLLSRHLDPAEQSDVHPSYAKVLAQLAPIDAKAMLIYRQNISHRGARDVGLLGGGITMDFLADRLSISNRMAFLSSLNLSRLGVTEHNDYWVPDNHPMPELFKDSFENQRYRITEYGIAFCDACRNDRED